MSYRQSNAKSRKTLRGGAIGAIVLALLLLTPLWGFIENGVQRVAAPIWRGGDALGARVFSISTAFVSNKEALVKKNQELEEEIKAIRLKLLDRNLLLEENLELQEMLGRDVYGDRTISARALSGPGSSPYDTLVIDIGENKGVAVGDKIFVSGTVMAGNIVEVFAQTSRALLLSSPGEEFEVFIAGNIEATAKGRGGGNFTIELPRDAEVSVGDVVRTVSSSIGIIGFVEHIEVNPSNPFQKIFLKSSINIFDISWVEVLKQN